ncbi:ABC transporter substrate binding protein [Variovorax sp. KBW07]|uniref:ABC transporter substrate binding protein n=1 Tax=Variovorax sp. KBW07 TaxID=2153358 RepID=UPI0021A9FDF4|nr:ABC transporter substrate binding protein [Variovorax sp. KBW07]
MKHPFPFVSARACPRPVARALQCLGLCLGLTLAGHAASAASLTVLMGDDIAASSEFVQQLRADQEPGSRFELVRLSPGGTEPPLSADSASTAAGTEAERAANAGVRTRSLRTADAGLTMAVGPAAARAAVERPGQEPLVLAMLSRLDYEALKAGSPALRRGDRRVGVLLRDPAMADQLALINAVLPQKHRIGVVATPESEPLVRELQRAAQGANPAWDVRVEYAPDARSLAAALRVVVPQSDALMVLPDLIGDNQAATLSVLRAGAGAGLPVFGASEGLVRSGGLAAAVSTPSQLAQQARLLGQKVASASASASTAAGGSNGAPLVEAATPATVRVNATVARGLGLRLPEERELTERLAAPR